MSTFIIATIVGLAEFAPGMYQMGFLTQTVLLTHHTLSVLMLSHLSMLLCPTVLQVVPDTIEYYD